MMKPTNLKEEGCSPVSSNCVIWQGEDIDCLGICKGDTVSDVVFQLGCMLCSLKDQLDVDTYDLTCLNLATCDIPHTFRELMQYLIELMCQLHGDEIGGTQTGALAAVSEKILTVASCFQSGGISQPVSDYVSLIGQKVCELEVSNANKQTAIEQLIARIEILESKH